MQPVRNPDEVKRNLQRLEVYRTSGEERERDFFRELIRDGICFLVYDEGERLLLGPSRFIGYVDNDIARHKASSDKHGGETNAAIEAIFGPFAPNDECESVYGEFCAQNAIEARPTGAFGQPRKYVIYPPRISGRLSEEVSETSFLPEGAVRRVFVNAYERSPEARRRCIEAHGTNCCICGFSFGEVYGKEAEGYIHVHHLRPLSEVGGEYVVNPVKDLRPVCPNCHAVLHLGPRCRSIEEVSDLMASTTTSHEKREQRCL